ncbi:CheW domain protein (plasmid) [Deinococcus proteolyticus MRP]|uniref:CheW domain protein n=1 Tax=Deinococcus proteolyticus (strain ATCC 35074 / DSM 20540 / JCM 6276 / NBRC 101906 / NCIMB 13154 / VKM Ac-1939 / CCM 2703 / MRP) TaxID=693977 RepID=F0RPT4_DEIPM|nr:MULTISPECIES: chemotaxis protein CheW [Deinococcus]ADY27390.1 CheW domain protein [Deinococcus proteolyticus MRP]MCY1704265.1 chemotaxis protein CheW [Deinococcus sp. SL84]
MAERLLLFRYKGEVLGLPAPLSREVIELDQVAPLPGSRGGLAGLVAASGQARPLLDLHRLAGLPRHQASLGLVAQVGEELLVFPMDEVVGNLTAEETLTTSEMISAPQDTGDYRLDFKVRVINPGVLSSTLQARLTPV